ncbi:MAG: alcohol dehydrogenase catalytic domain-containing protein [Verrucomicrobia bacterium]|nr:alcohol dehydrogenase catalytic domain-containing protein [Verrucomicrobiota bacterium]MCH8513321.1 alcohol dehydrogenase catalytic domain-containing protein [Kiritimatiellia bacterium]
MKAMFLTGIRQIEIRETPSPSIRNPDDVLIRMGAVGICGSDVHYYSTGRIGAQVVEYPFTVGHEGAGTVVEVGSSVTKVRPGDRIAIEPAITCGCCDQCRAGRANTCRNNRFLGCPGQIPGCLAEYIVMPEACCFPLRDTTPMEWGPISEPLAIGVYAVKNSVPMSGAKIGILGMGPIGMTVLLPALHAGGASAYCTDKVDARIALAQKAGAGYIGNPLRQNVVADILEQEPLGLDVVFECCGQQEALDQAMDLLKPGGTLMVIGIPEVDRVSFNVDAMRRKEIRIQNVRRQEGCVQEALDLIESGALNVEPLITHNFPFEQTAEAFDLVETRRDGVMKAMIRF